MRFDDYECFLLKVGPDFYNTAVDPQHTRQKFQGSLILFLYCYTIWQN